MMKYQDEIEAVRRQAEIKWHTTLSAGGEDLAGHEWACGVEDALVWVMGNGTSDRMAQLVHDAEARKDLEDQIPSDLLEKARARAKENPDPDYRRALVDLLVDVADLGQVDDEGIVAGLLGVDLE